MPKLYFRMDDGGVHNIPGLIPIDPRDAQKWNSEQWGIFWTVNDFVDGMKVEHLQKLKAWYLDIDLEDNANKPQALKMLLDADIQPSMINETSRGFHAYWRMSDGTQRTYRGIQKALSKKFGGDNLVNVNRVLRVPGMNHWKNPEKPYLIETVLLTNVRHTEETMLNWLDVIEEKEQIIKDVVAPRADGTIFGELSQLDCRKALLKISGTRIVKGEVYTFRKNYDGSYQIIVNGKAAGAWIDREGFIGSYDGGGPTIVQWLKWFEHDWATIARIGEKVLLNTKEGTYDTSNS